MYEHCPVNPVIFLATGSETEIGHAKKWNKNWNRNYYKQNKTRIRIEFRKILELKRNLK